MNTSKKMKVIGHQDYINRDTQEIETMQVITIEERDAREKAEQEAQAQQENNGYERSDDD